MTYGAHEPQTGDEKTRESSKRKWFEDLKKAKEQELEKLGLDPSQVRRSFHESRLGQAFEFACQGPSSCVRTLGRRIIVSRRCVQLVRVPLVTASTPRHTPECYPRAHGYPYQ